MPHSAQPQHTKYWAPQTRKRHQQEHRPQRPTESSDPTQHAKGRTSDRPGPRKGATTRRNVTQGVPPPLPMHRWGGGGAMHPPHYVSAYHLGIPPSKKKKTAPPRAPPPPPPRWGLRPTLTLGRWGGGHGVITRSRPPVQRGHHEGWSHQDASPSGPSVASDSV